MQRTIAYKYQLKTTPKIDTLLNQFAGAQRFVWNKILGFQNDRFKFGEKKLTYVQTANLLPLMKQQDDTSWLRLIPAQTLQQTLKDLDRAYTNFFQKRTELPVFKKKGIRDSFRYPDGKQIKLDQINNRIFLPKLGFVNYRNSRAINGKINSVTISKENNHWYISINFTQDCEVKSVAPINSIVGIDIGVTRFASLSTGDYLEPMNSFRKSETKTIKLSKLLSRKKRFSNNWKKAKNKLSKHHTKIARIRKDYLHQTTNYLTNNFNTIVIEDLKVCNMSKSAKGTVDNPGKNIKAKSGLNKSILDQGWFEFKRQLEYKLSHKGGRLIKIDPKYTSQTCADCGHLHQDNRKSQAVFECKACGYKNNADTNAAINILRLGQSQLAC